MWKRNLRTFFKHLINNKIYTVVTVFGFAISLTFVLLLSIYIKNENAVNANHINKDRIFRLVSEEYDGFAPAIGPWLQNTFPEIESFTRTYRNDGVVEVSTDLKVKMNYLMADSTFFNIFTFNLIEGNPETALKTKHSVVLTKAFANKLFGKEPALGKQISLRGYIPLTVGGVVDDIAENSNFFKCDAVVNYRLLSVLWDWPDFLSNYGNCSFGLYFLAKPNTNLPAKAPQVLKMFKKDFWLYKDNYTKTVAFEPLKDVYFSKVGAHDKTFNSKTLLKVLSAIVVLILVLAIINYMNLTIAQSSMRVKETAIKKLVGSSRRFLINQHIVESVVLCLFAFSLALLFSFLLEPIFNNLLNSKIVLSQELSPKFIGISLILVILVGVFSGFIPALVITKLDAVEVIKGSFRRKNKSVNARILIGFQYVVVIVLLIATLIISKQTKFLQTKDMGFNTTNVIWFDSNTNLTGDTGLKNKLKSVAGVKEVAFVQGSPMDGGNNQTLSHNEKMISFQEFIVDSAFFDIMQMNIEYTGVANSENAYYLNRKAVKELELDDLPTSFNRYGQQVPVVGVVDDFNYGSLHKAIGPAMIRLLGENDYPWNIIIQLEGQNLSQILNNIGEVYGEYTGGQPFDAQFMDATIAYWYAREKRTAKIVAYFTILTIVIAAMGIFAMSVFYIQQKVKEIGIRKVNGAKVGEVMQMLNRDFIVWVVVAFFIASPIAWIAMNKWLQNFAYKTEISWWVFALAGLSATAIALFTVSLQTFRAARRNPVEALRYE